MWASVTKPPRWLCRNGPWPRSQLRRTRRLVIPGRSGFSPGWRRKWANPTALSPLYRNCSRYRLWAHCLKTYRLLLRCSGSIPCSTRFAVIRASKNSARKSRTERCAKIEFITDCTARRSRRLRKFFFPRITLIDANHGTTLSHGPDFSGCDPRLTPGLTIQRFNDGRSHSRSFACFAGKTWVAAVPRHVIRGLQTGKYFSFFLKRSGFFSFVRG